MTKNILAAVGGLALVALLGANAVATFGAGEAPAVRTGAISIADLPITQLVSMYTDTYTATWTMPSDAGFLLTGLADGDWGTTVRNMLVRINGVDAWQSSYSPYRGEQMPRLSPGIVVYPGSTVEVSSSTTSTSDHRLTITGYWLTLADLGM